MSLGADHDQDRYAQAALHSECQRASMSCHGRNEQLNRSAFAIGQMVGARWVERAEAERRLYAAAEASGYVAKDGPAAARATIKSGLDKGQRAPRQQPNGANGHAAGLNGHAHPRKPEPRLSDVPLPIWTTPGEDGKPKFVAIGKAEPPRFDGEIRRHLYHRDGEVVRVKVKQSTTPAFVDWYHVKRPSDGAIGWQARKPGDYAPVPYLPPGSGNPFDAERRGEGLAWSEGEKDADTLHANGFLAFTFGGTSDVPELGDLLAGHHVYIVADNDAPGGKVIARKVDAALKNRAASIKIVRFPELQEGGDASDFFERGGTAEEFMDRAEVVDPEAWGRKSDQEHNGADPGSSEQASNRSDSDTAQPISITATPFRWRDPRSFPRRDWLYGHHLIRKFISCTVAPGGLGKSSLVLVEAIAMATGRPLLGTRPRAPMTVWIINLEDPLEELERRIVAILLHYKIDPAEIEGRLFIDSGRTLKLVIAETTRNGTQIARPLVDAFAAEIRARVVDVVMIDPFVKCHRVPENDNTAVDMVATTFAEIADDCGCAFDLIHHVRKTGGAEVTVEDGRGGSALLGAVRSARTLNGMTKDEAERAGEPGSARQFFRVANGKLNMAPPPPDRADWFKLVSVSLGNASAPDGPPDDGDHVQCVTSWAWPDPQANVTVQHLREVQAAVAVGRWRENLQAKDWVGLAIAKVLKLDPTNKAHRTTILGNIKVWLASGALVTVQSKDERGNSRPYVEVGELAT